MPPGGPTGRKTEPTGRKTESATVPGKNPHTGEPQGELLRHPPGSNGEVRRGPDLKPRHVIKAIYLKTITDAGRLALPPDSENGRRRSGAARRKRAKAAHAFITNSSDAMQGIALDAAEGDPVARGQLLRLLHDMHEALQPAPDEAKSGGGPILPKFNRRRLDGLRDDDWERQYSGIPTASIAAPAGVSWEALQPAPDEAKSGGGPILSKFNRPTQPVAPAQMTEPAEDLPAVVDEDGNPYVDAG